MPKYESVRPFGNRIMVRPDEPASMTETGLYLPENAVDRRNMPVTGIVVAVGEGRFEATLAGPVRIPIEVGQGVLFGQYDGVEFEHAGEVLVVLNADQVMAVMTPKANALEVRPASAS